MGKFESVENRKQCPIFMGIWGKTGVCPIYQADSAADASCTPPDQNDYLSHFEDLQRKGLGTVGIFPKRLITQPESRSRCPLVNTNSSFERIRSQQRSNHLALK